MDIGSIGDGISHINLRNDPSAYQRREFVKLSVGFFLGLTAALPSLAQQARDANRLNGRGASPGPINWDAFLEYLDRAARVQFQPSWDQGRYVQEIEKMVQSLSLTDSRLTRALQSARPHRGIPHFEDLEQRMSFQITLITFENGEILPLHDHPRMTGVMTCATGMVDVQRFHLLAVGKDRDSFTLRDEGLVGMTPGSVSSLTAETHNIHGLKARSFSQIIDIFTPPYDSARIKDSRWFRVTPSGTKSNEVTATLL